MSAVNYYNLNYYQQLNYIFENVQFVISLLGIIGNALNVVVFMRKRLKKYSFSFYNIALAWVDIFILMHSFRHWAALIFDANIDLAAPFFCTIGEYQPTVATFTSLWILTLISVDRLIITVYPNRFNVIKKRWFQGFLVLLIVLYSCLINIQLPLNYEIISINLNGNNNSSQIPLVIRMCTLPLAVRAQTSWIHLVNLILVNIVINNALNLMLIKAMYNSRRRVQNSTNSTNGLNSRDRKFAINSIGLNLKSMILRIPLALALLLTNYLPLSIDQIQFFFTISVNFLLIDSSAVFFVNMLLNSLFYNEFLTLIRKDCNAINESLSLRRGLPQMAKSGEINHRTNKILI